MNLNLLCEVGFFNQFLAVCYWGLCVILVLTVLVQKGRGGGLNIGGGGSGQSAFGAKTGDAFTWITIVLAALFITCGVAISIIYKPKATLADTSAPAIQSLESEAVPTDGDVTPPATDEATPTADETAPATDKTPLATDEAPPKADTTETK
jgi:preprotein translocase subunit SecG